MDHQQHTIQDSCELYTAYVMQKTAENLGVATTQASHERWAEFMEYLTECGLSLDQFETGLYGKYKTNVDHQVPRFMERLAQHYKGSTFHIPKVDEARKRIDGLKGDIDIEVSGLSEPKSLSLKNYIGSGGITRPQVSSGTYLSFACGFVFERVGVGQYEDPRPASTLLDDGKPRTFSGSDVATRNEVLDFMSESEHLRRVRLLKGPLELLDRLQAEMRAELLGPDCEFYDKDRVRAVVDKIAYIGIDTVLHIFDVLGEDIVRRKFLDRIGMSGEGKEEALFFDSERYVDSITNPKYHVLREQLNADSTKFSAYKHKQNIRFEFTGADGKTLLKTDVPFTINTNGAWHRPKERYDGVELKVDKGHEVWLEWGQRRPYKCKEIATSTNTYLDLAKTGIFGK